MCGLIYSSSEERSARYVTANLARAGRNKGAFTFTEIRRSMGGSFAGPVQSVSTTSAQPLSGAGVFHLQAPTCAESLPHPATWGEVALWHNGIVKPEGIRLLQELTGSEEKWDTKLLAMFLAEHPPGSEMFRTTMGKIPGSFACVLLHKQSLLAFRNAISPLYTNGEDLSSVPVWACDTMIKPGLVLTLATGGWVSTAINFECEHNPYDL